ncbi:MAG: proline dehydrogenase [Bacillota bacterium]|nr:MAG: proline dehydrogenase [Bacillota bacterium]
MAALARAVVLKVFQRPGVRRWMERHGMALGAGRFVAGETAGDALRVAAGLLAAGRRVSLTHLGEYTSDAAAARAAADTYVDLLAAARRRALEVGLSIKLTQLGLDLDLDVCLENTRRVLDAAAGAGALVEIDMEDSARVDATLAVFQRLAPEYPFLGVCLQAYLHRTPDDIQRLAPLRPRIRLVKGAYAEPPSVALQDRAAVTRRYLELARRLMDAGCFLAAASHDGALLREVLGEARRRGLGPDRYEVQMLRGINPSLQEGLVAAGEPVRVLVVYGREWYPWFVRRLAERPANVGMLLRNLVSPAARRRGP